MESHLWRILIRSLYGGFKGSFNIGWHDPRHILIKFDLEEDYMRLLLKCSWSLHGYPMRDFKW